MKIYLNSKGSFLYKGDKGTLVPVPPIKAAQLLIEHSNFKHLRIYQDVNNYYIYNSTEGIYIKISSDYLRTLTRKILQLTDDHRLYTHEYVTKVVNNLLISDLSYSGAPKPTRGYVAFMNGVLNLNTKEFVPHSPELFLTSKVSFVYDPKATCPRFMEFLQEFSLGHSDRISFVKAWLNALIFQRIDYQIFLVLIGQAATGKSTLAHVATALVGIDGTITTSLKSLHKDNFEIINLIAKKLILISDSEHYSGDLQILKQIVGCDALQGRAKYIQGSFEVRPEGIVLIVTNNPITSRDTSQALVRRMRTFKAERVFEERRPLISCVDGIWVGPLGEELSGIFNFIYNMNETQVYNYLVNMKTSVPSLSGFQDEQAELINPLLHWVRDELSTGEGAYIGYKLDKGSKGILEESRRRALYPAYHSWCTREGITPMSHKRFTYEILLCLKAQGFICEKVKRNLGIFIKGVALNPDIYNRDYLHGAPIIPIESPEPPKEASSALSLSPQEALYKAPSKGSYHPSLDKDLYKKYMQALGPSELKIALNSIVKDSLPLRQAEVLTKEFTKDAKINSMEYYEKMYNQILKGLKTIKKNGLIPYHYKPLGVSPRILPVGYSMTINSVKRIVRDYAYKFVAAKARDSGLDINIADLDIKSCYTSILLGLYPLHLSRLQEVLEYGGLWAYIKEEFEKNGRGSVYNKPAVKICTYSSFFQGGNNAMITGIMENHRKMLGLTPDQFRKSSFYEELHAQARDVATEMMNSEVVLDFRAVSSRVQEEYKGEIMIGPTGHSYIVTDESFKTAYPNFLQSFEFALLAQSSLNVLSKYKKIEVIGHYHDGNVVVVPKGSQDLIIEELKALMLLVGKSLGLCYKQELEVKSIF
nr:putative phage/plasmid DNA primase [Oedogonium sp. 210]